MLDPTPWKKSLYLLDGEKRSELKKTNELVYYVRSVCMDFAQRFPSYAAETQHNYTSLARTADSIIWSKSLNRTGQPESGWKFQLRARGKELDDTDIIEYLKVFDIHCASADIRQEQGRSTMEIHMVCYMFAADFPIMLMYRRMYGLDREAGSTRWTNREGSF